MIIFQDKSRISLSKKYGIKKTLIVLPPYQKNIHCRQKISSKEKVDALDKDSIERVDVTKNNNTGEVRVTLKKG